MSQAAADTELKWAPFSVDYGLYSPLMSGSIDGTDTRPHDRGVVRAMSVKYKPNKQVTGDPKRTVFVARLSHDTSEDVLKEIFSKYGKIEKCQLIRDIVTGRSKGYGFVEFKHLRDAEDAYNRANKKYLDGSQIVVEFECSRSLTGWVPRRFGGGFGGKKESGQLRFGGRDRPFRKPIVLGSKSLNRSHRDFGSERGRASQRDFGRTSSRDDRGDREQSYERSRERRSERRQEERAHDRTSERERERHRGRRESRDSRHGDVRRSRDSHVPRVRSRSRSKST